MIRHIGEFWAFFILVFCDLEASLETGNRNISQTLGVSKFYWCDWQVGQCSTPCNGGMKISKQTCNCTRNESSIYARCESYGDEQTKAEKCNTQDCPTSFISYLATASFILGVIIVATVIYRKRAANRRHLRSGIVLEQQSYQVPTAAVAQGTYISQGPPLIQNPGYPTTTQTAGYSGVPAMTQNPGYPVGPVNPSYNPPYNPQYPPHGPPPSAPGSAAMPPAYPPAYESLVEKH